MKRLIVLVTILCFSLNFFWNCSSKSTEPQPEVDLPGIWSDDSTITFQFNDSTWVWGVNSGEVVPENESSGSLFLEGVLFGDYQIEGDQLVIHIFPDDETFTLDQVSTEALDTETLSLITRRGNYIAFATNRAGDDAGDIFIYTVDTNANLDTVYYYNIIITSRDTVIDEDTLSVKDTTLVRSFLEPLRQLTTHVGQDENPSWSPDGSKLAFVSDRSGEPAIWVYFLDNFANLDSNISGDNPRQLTKPGTDLGDASPTWSPDGKSLAFSRRSGVDVEELRDVLIIPSDDYGDESKVLNFTDTEDYDCFAPEWSGLSDMNIILFESRPNENSSDWDVYWKEGTDSSAFTGDKEQMVTNPNRNGHPTWSPDGKLVAFERNPPGSLDKYDINIQSFTSLSDSAADESGINPTPLTNQTDFVGLNRYPTWLPGGHLIAFMRMDDIWLIDISDGIDNPTHRKLLEDEFKNWDIAW